MPKITKSLLVLLMVGAVLTSTVGYSFGDIVGVSSFYLNDEPINFLEIGQEYEYKVTLRGAGSFPYKGDAQFFVANTVDNSQISLSNFNFHVKAADFETFRVTHNPDQTGRFLLTMVLSEEGNAGILDLSEEMTHIFYVVNGYGKVFKENNACPKEGHKPVVKPNFSSVVCVTEETKSTLVNRGWHFG